MLSPSHFLNNFIQISNEDVQHQGLSSLSHFLHHLQFSQADIFTFIQIKFESVFNTLTRLCSKLQNTICYSWSSQYDQGQYCFLCELSSISTFRSTLLSSPAYFLPWKADWSGPGPHSSLVSGFLLGLVYSKSNRGSEAGQRLRLRYLFSGTSS